MRFEENLIEKDKPINVSNKKHILLMILFSIYVLPISGGFAAGWGEPEIREDWKIEYFGPPTATLRSANVYQERPDDTIYVSGRLVRALKSGRAGGYILLSIMKDNTVYFNARSEYLSLNAAHHRRQGSYFRINIPFIPVKGSRILLKYYIHEKDE